MTMTASTTYTSRQTCAFCDLTYRQLDYWMRCGVLGPLTPITRGSGSQRMFTVDAVHVLRVLSRLTSAVDARDDRNARPAWQRDLSPSLPLTALTAVAQAFIEAGCPTDGYLVSSPAGVHYAPDVVDAVAALLPGGSAGIVLALHPDDRPAGPVDRDAAL